MSKSTASKDDQGTRPGVWGALPVPASCVFMDKRGTRCTAKNSTHFHTASRPFLIGFLDPHTGILFDTQAPCCSWATIFPPLPPAISKGGLILLKSQLEPAPVNNIPPNPAHTTTNWPPSSSQRLGLHTTSPRDQLQLRNLFVVSQPHRLVLSWSQPVAAAQQSGPPGSWHRPYPRILYIFYFYLFCVFFN